MPSGAGKFHSKSIPVKRNLGDHDPSQCNHMLNGEFIHHKPKRATEGKELVTLYGGEGTRYLIVPNRKPIDVPGIFSKSEVERLKQESQVITKKDKLRMMEEAEQQRRQLQDESDQRKQALQEALATQGKQGKLSRAERDAKAKNQYLLQRAYDLRQEQEDEVKRANGVILATKCRAIRNAQIKEKKLIRKDLEEEERRLDMMMEQARQREIAKEEKRRETEEKKNQKYVEEVKEQIREHELQKMLDAERIEEESRNLNRALIAMQRQEEEKRLQKLEEQRKTREELKQANEELERYKYVQQEEERIADMRVQEFMRKKAEREAAREAEERDAQAAKERELARLRAQQQRAQDQQAAADELNALRIMEEVEREWREKEKRIAQKKKEQQMEMKMGREKQIDDLRRAAAIELARDEQEFHQVAKVQNEQHQKELEKQAKKKEAAICHRMELLKQINEKERERINKVHEKFEEGNALRLEKDIRERHVNEYLVTKMDRLRLNNVPEMYITDIKRQLKLK